MPPEALVSGGIFIAAAKFYNCAQNVNPLLLRFAQMAAI